MYCYTPAVTFTIEGSGVNWVNLNGITGIEVSQKGNLNQVYAEALDKLVRDTSLQKNILGLHISVLQKIF